MLFLILSLANFKIRNWSKPLFQPGIILFFFEIQHFRIDIVKRLFLQNNHDFLILIYFPRFLFSPTSLSSEKSRIELTTLGFHYLSLITSFCLINRLASWKLLYFPMISSKRLPLPQTFLILFQSLTARWITIDINIQEMYCYIFHIHIKFIVSLKNKQTKNNYTYIYLHLHTEAWKIKVLH